MKPEPDMVEAVPEARKTLSRFPFHQQLNKFRNARSHMFSGTYLTIAVFTTLDPLFSYTRQIQPNNPYGPSSRPLDPTTTAATTTTTTTTTNYYYYHYYYYYYHYY